MSPENFCYWLQGFFEVSNGKVTLSDTQIQIIKDHLKLVFNKQTPNRTQGSQDFSRIYSTVPTIVSC